MEQYKYKHDIFISHASEDKDDFVRPLAKLLINKRYRIWYDEFSLTIGDSLSSSINKGLAESRFGLIVISPKFIEKRWTDWELKGLVQRQLQDGKKVILPIWHEVTQKQVYDFYPTLADMYAANSSKGLENVIDQIVQVLERAGVVLGETETVTSEKGIDYNSTIEPSTATDDLSSEKGIDYTKLSKLLAEKNWKEADEETYRVMIQAVDKEDGDYFTSDELLNFPCTDLRTIDGLWVDSDSDKRFGFSVQKEIYLRVGGKADGQFYPEAYLKFCERVGWRVRVERKWISLKEVTFNTTAKKGHLPWFVYDRLERPNSTSGVGLGDQFRLILSFFEFQIKDPFWRDHWGGWCLLSHRDL